ncbi:MAG: 3-oxoacyl-ACP reductase FabG [Syntrophaceae bacterium]|nr:3-oxoacyl-ACP reductase FabG [Syntrophaceae bacterium]NTW76295.1 3-oxoacyl-ACP reductase FabG [Syntrophaceae bacterium]
MMEKPVALVTGGATGIGAACCRALSQEGFRVGVHYRKSGEQAQKVLEEIKDGFLIQADLTNIEDVEAMVGRLKENTRSIDVLVNNAGQSINADIFSMKIEQFDEQRALTRGVWYMTKRILRQFMLRSPAGRIINISSVVGYLGNAGQIPYTMEKAALDAFTKSLAQELRGRNILVNSVAPGFIETEMTQELPEEVKSKIMAGIILNRIGLPEEVAEVVAFLAKKGSYITGSVIHVNGGLYGG